ncbi:MAG: hypothetical protein FWE87_00690 [Coriobacteriia bacterium]|nr:hypothetical protein [Coriobacteriia bacterium]
MERIRDFFRANGISDDDISAYIENVISPVRFLANQADMGFSIGMKYGYTTPYRGLVVWDGRYLVVYEPTNTAKKIQRVYSTRENYVKDLMP